MSSSASEEFSLLHVELVSKPTLVLTAEINWKPQYMGDGREAGHFVIPRTDGRAIDRSEIGADPSRRTSRGPLNNSSRIAGLQTTGRRELKGARTQRSQP